MTKILDRRPTEFLWAAVPPCVFCSVTAWLVIASAGEYLSHYHPIVQVATLAGGYCVIVGLFFATCSRGRVQELLQTMRVMRPARSRTPFVSDVDAEGQPFATQDGKP